jgi:SAM-dependent methyltransferase
VSTARLLENDGFIVGESAGGFHIFFRMNGRLRSEQHFHDAQSAQRRRAWEDDPRLLRMASEAYLDHEPWVRGALGRLGPLVGKRVLDFGCGHGMASTVLAREGAQVVAFDLSSGYVHETHVRAAANGVIVQTLVADGARLPFADQVFDAIWGVAILHHLPLAQAAREIRRVLRPGGTAVFCEPWGGNPLLHLARRYFPYPGKERTRDEAPLLPADLQPLRAAFPDCEVEYVQLLGMVRRAWRSNPWASRLDQWDRRLLRRFPSIGKWCRYVVIALR